MKLHSQDIGVNLMFDGFDHLAVHRCCDGPDPFPEFPDSLMMGTVYEGGVFLFESPFLDEFSILPKFDPVHVAGTEILREKLGIRIFMPVFPCHGDDILDIFYSVDFRRNILI